MIEILVEEVLKARRAFDIQNKNDLIINKVYSRQTIMDNSDINYSDVDELISDKGIIYKKHKNKKKSEYITSENSDAYKKDLL